MRDKDGNLINIPADELAKISLGLSKLRNQFNTPSSERKTAPQLLRELLAKSAASYDDKSESVTDIIEEQREHREQKLFGTLLEKYDDKNGQEPCQICGRCVCEDCIAYMSEHKAHCDKCNAFTPEQKMTNDDAWNTARDYYKKVHEKSIAKMNADQEYARKINEKFENERLQEKSLREYDNAMNALEEAKEKHEKAMQQAELLAQLIRDAENKKAKAHDEYEWICNNAPKR